MDWKANTPIGSSTTRWPTWTANVHTNTLENFWSLLKRGISGTYVSVEPFHLFRYLDEQAFRYNNRDKSDAQRFTEAMKNVFGRRITFAELSGKNHDPRLN